MRDFSLVIPFYNEGERVINLLRQLSKSYKVFREVICVDDGSSDAASETISLIFPWVRLVKMQNNMGKSAAVKKGISISNGNNIVLMDADLKGVENMNWKNIFRVFWKHNLTMLIIARRRDRTLDRLVLGGERIIDKEMLSNLIKLEKPTKYLLETAINKFLIDNNEPIGIYQSSLENISSLKKRGFLKGLLKEISMYFNYFRYLGLFGYLKQIIYFDSLEKKGLT